MSSFTFFLCDCDFPHCWKSKSHWKFDIETWLLSAPLQSSCPVMPRRLQLSARFSNMPSARGTAISLLGCSFVVCTCPMQAYTIGTCISILVKNDENNSWTCLKRSLIATSDPWSLQATLDRWLQAIHNPCIRSSIPTAPWADTKIAFCVKT